MWRGKCRRGTKFKKIPGVGHTLLSNPLISKVGRNKQLFPWKMRITTLSVVNIAMKVSQWNKLVSYSVLIVALNTCV
jgi:hypothetical protein